METSHIPEPQATEKTVRLSLYLPEDIRKALRIRAIEEGTSATKLVERLIREYLSRGIGKGSGQ
jgi:plasmid stability protein